MIVSSKTSVYIYGGYAMKTECYELIGQKAWDLFNRFRGNMTQQDFLPLFTGLLLLVEKDEYITGGEFRNRIGNRNANITVDEIIEYGYQLEKKNECPQGFFGKYAFRRIHDLDSILLCEFLISLWIIYDDAKVEKKALSILAYVLEMHSITNGKLGGEYAEPSFLRKLICKLADVKEGESVYDPCMGVAGYALCLLQNYEGLSFCFTGKEINRETFYLAHAVLIMGQISEYNIYNGNSLIEPIISDDHQLMMFDKVITNPPFGLRLDDKTFEMISNDLYGRFHYGIPGKANADWLFIENAISSTKESGKAVVVTSNGPLFRSIEGKVRANILMKQDILEAVIQLPGGLMQNTSLPVSILIFNKNKADNMRGKVLSIDASDMGSVIKGRRSYRELTVEDINKVVDAYNNPSNIEGFTRLYSFEEIEENDYNFNLVSIGKNQQLTAKLAGYITLDSITTEVVRGVQITPKTLEEVKDKKGSHYLLNLSNIDNGKIVFADDENDRINPQKKWIKNYEVHAGDLLVAARGAFKCAIVEADLPDCIASGNLIIIRLREYSPYVLKYYFESELGQQLISQLQSGVAAPIINAASLEKIKVPSIDAEKMKKYEAKICLYQSEYEQMIRKAEEYKKSEEEELNAAMQLLRISM